MTVAGAGGVLGMLVTVTVRGEGLAGPAASRPRGRPFAAYVVSCVGMMTLPAGRRTDPSRCDSIDRPDLNDDQVFNALNTKILTLPSRVERAHPTRLHGYRHHEKGAIRCDCAAASTTTVVGGARARHAQASPHRAAITLSPFGAEPPENRSPPARSAPASLSDAQTPIVAARAAAMGSPENSLPRTRL